MCHSYDHGFERAFESTADDETDEDTDGDDLPSFAEEEGADVELLTDGGDES